MRTFPLTLSSPWVNLETSLEQMDSPLLETELMGLLLLLLLLLLPPPSSEDEDWGLALPVDSRSTCCGLCQLVLVGCCC